eukprot:s4026_g3.t1
MLPLSLGDNIGRRQLCRLIMASAVIFDTLVAQSGTNAMRATYWTTGPPTWWPSDVILTLITTMAGTRKLRKEVWEHAAFTLAPGPDRVLGFV